MKKIQWEKQVPIFRNRFILKDLLIALGLPFGVLISILLVLSNGDVFGTDVKYALFMVAILFLLTFIFVILIYGGMYAPGFIIDEKGITNYTQSGQREKNRIVNGLLILLGFFSRNPGAVGIGLLAEGKQCIKIDWKHIRKAQYYPKKHAILVRGTPTSKIVLFCTAENYERVEKIVRAHVSN